MEEIVQSTATNTKNGVIISYGQSKSGKSTHLFGNQKAAQTGMMQLAVNKFFELATPQIGPSKQAIASNIYLYIFDVSLETIRDFGKYFFNP